MQNTWDIPVERREGVLRDLAQIEARDFNANLDSYERDPLDYFSPGYDARLRQLSVWQLTWPVKTRSRYLLKVPAIREETLPSSKRRANDGGSCTVTHGQEDDLVQDRSRVAQTYEREGGEEETSV